jgi:hypothetical protein
MQERPSGVPEAAVWSTDDDEWVLATTNPAGEHHGLVTYWRPDGTLVNHCSFVDGVPHGWYKRYHPSGEVSRQGSYEGGKVHGTDVFHRSDAPTSEAFPRGLGERVWRAEMDMNQGAVMAGRCYDRAGHQVSESGEPYPARPAAVPERASFTAKTGRWLEGATDERFQRHGLWRFYDAGGTLVEETAYDHGAEAWSQRYGSAQEAAAEVALP